MAGAATSKPPDNIEPIQENLVREELERVCADLLFRDTTRMKRFLRFVVEETLAGRGGRLKGYIIGVEVFDRPDNFDPQSDTIVRVQAGQLRRRLDLYYADRGQESLVRILVPKGRYAPVFELRQTSPIDETVDPLKIVKDDVESLNDPRPSLAVITLDDLSSKTLESRDFFADGLSAEIVNALVQFRSLRVVTLTPTVSTKLARKSVRDIGLEIGADFVLSGSVRRDGEAFRVTVSLIRCETSEHVFSRIFDREYKLGSLFNLQEEIASYTAAAIAAPYGAVNRYNRRNLDVRQSSMAAYNCVLRYYDIKLSPSRVEVENLLRDVVVVTKNQPRFSMGWTVHALLNNFLGTQIQEAGQSEQYLAKAEKAAKRAVKTDSQNPLGHFALYQSFFHRGDFEQAERMIGSTMSLNPNDYSVLAYYALCLAVKGEFDAAFKIGSAALRLIGRAPTWYHMPQMIIDFVQGKYEIVAGVVDRDLGMRSHAFYLMGLAAKVHLGEVEETRLLIREILDRDPDYAFNVSQALNLWHLDPEIAERIDAGLTAAGLDIEALKSSRNG